MRLKLAAFTMLLCASPLVAQSNFTDLLSSPTQMLLRTDYPAANLTGTAGQTLSIAPVTAETLDSRVRLAAVQFRLKGFVANLDLDEVAALAQGLQQAQKLAEQWNQTRPSEHKELVFNARDDVRLIMIWTDTGLKSHLYFGQSPEGAALIPRLAELLAILQQDLALLQPK